MRNLLIIVLISVLVHSICCKRSFKRSKQEPIDLPDSLEMQYQYPELAWNDKLQETSKQAAQQILESNSFGQHSEIEKWQAAIPNDIFSEICFIVNVTNSNYYSKSLSSKTSKIMYDTKMSIGTVMKTVKAPSAEMFAKNIIEALEAEHLLLTLNQYSDCGIALQDLFNIIDIDRVPLDQAKYPNEYLTVIHLIKGGSAAPEKVTYTSCKDALEKGNKDSQITIVVNGKEHQVFCDQTTQGGGWTQIYKVNKDFGKVATQEIDDLGLDYTNVFFRSSPSTVQNFAPSGWKSVGWNIAMDVMKFGDVWWASEETPYTRTQFDQMSNGQKFRAGNDLNIISKSGQCFFGNVNHDGYCALDFIFKNLPATGKLNAISDYESVNGSLNYDNTYYFDLVIYVR